jgi:hypothetical protein
MSSLLTETLEGFSAGMNQAVRPHEIGDNQARWLQDVFVHHPGETDMRGPVAAYTNSYTPGSGNRGYGIVSASDPSGVVRAALLHDSGAAAFLDFLSDDLSSRNGFFQINGRLADQTGDYILSQSPAIGGGAFIGISSKYEQGATQQLLYWRGARKSNYSTGTATVSQGSTAVTGSGTAWLANVEPGMFLLNAAGTPIGTVASVNSDTSITLENAAWFALSAASYLLRTVRALNIRSRTGYITIQTGTLTTVSGANTKFLSQGLNDGGTWNLFRARDRAWIGLVASVQTDTVLTLSVNSPFTMDDEEYIAVRTENTTTLSSASGRRVGFLTANYAGVNWFANLSQSAKQTSRVYFSSDLDPEAIDMAEADGDYIDVTAGLGADTPIKALVPTTSSLLVLKETEAWAIQGNSSANFSEVKVNDDGALCGMSAASWDGGAIFAGRYGIYAFDGMGCTNIVKDSLGKAYRELISGFNPTTQRMWGMVENDHYLLYIESVTPSSPIIKGATSHTPSSMTIAVYLPTGAVTVHSNVHVKGGCHLPQFQNASFAVVNNLGGQTTASNTPNIIRVRDLFEKSGRDTIACDGGAAGPDPFIETKRFSMGDAELKKLWKYIILTYLAGGDNLALDTVLGLNDTGLTASRTFPESLYTWDTLSAAYPTWDALAAAYPTWDAMGNSLYTTKRLKFIKRSQLFGFRLYSPAGTITEMKLGPFQLAFKPQRIGRV